MFFTPPTHFIPSPAQADADGNDKEADDTYSDSAYGGGDGKEEGGKGNEGGKEEGGAFFDREDYNARCD